MLVGGSRSVIALSTVAMAWVTCAPCRRLSTSRPSSMLACRLSENRASTASANVVSSVRRPCTKSAASVATPETSP